MGAPLGSERGGCGGVSESGFLEQRATRGIGGSGGSWRPGREGGLPCARLSWGGDSLARVPRRRGGARGSPDATAGVSLAPCCSARQVAPDSSCTAMGNTTSDRVAGERHGAKAARAEGAGGHAPGKEHKIMVGSTDDPSVFSLPDSKVSVPTPPVGGDAAVVWVSGLLLPILIFSYHTDLGYGF